LYGNGSGIGGVVRRLSPVITPRDVAELPLLTLGSQLQGGHNNTIGQAAIKGIFLAVAEIAKGLITRQSATEIHIETPIGRVFLIALANDPDVRLEETTARSRSKLLSIEVKKLSEKGPENGLLPHVPSATPVRTREDNERCGETATLPPSRHPFSNSF